MSDPASDPIAAWLAQATTTSGLTIERMPFAQSRLWTTDANGCMAHASGRFFRIVGVRCTDADRATRFEQPLIDQPEVAMMCFVVAFEDGGWWVLVQAKVEPGNVGGAQLAPSVQATRSNLEAVHGGLPVPYAALAQTAERLYSMEQSEQGSRFWGKQNTNRVVRVPRRFAAESAAFRWIPLADLIGLLARSYVVNTDARSVLACWLFTDPSAAIEAGAPCRWLGAMLAGAGAPADDGIAAWIDQRLERRPLARTVVALAALAPSWTLTPELLSSESSALTVYHIRVHCRGREVDSWDQPILGASDVAQLVTTVAVEDGQLHLLLQARIEAGSRSYELSTTIHADSPALLTDWESRHRQRLESIGTRLVDFHNSEEGSRLDRTVGRYQIYRVPRLDSVELADGVRWVSIRELSRLLATPNRVTNELRSALSGLLTVGDLGP